MMSASSYVCDKCNALVPLSEKKTHHCFSDAVPPSEQPVQDPPKTPITLPSEPDPTDLGMEPHPAARSAYRWLKGFMVTNPKEWSMYKESLASAALAGNRQAEVCMGTIERMRNSQAIGDRYLMGLAWTILHLHNHEAMETIANGRVDRAYDMSDDELLKYLS